VLVWPNLGGHRRMNLPFLFSSSHPFSALGSSFTSFPRSLPSARSKRNTLSIFLLNFFLGWTLVGWVVALVWAMKVDDFPAAFVRASKYSIHSRASFTRFCRIFKDFDHLRPPILHKIHEWPRSCWHYVEWRSLC
jgi:hypothetical protein